MSIKVLEIRGFGGSSSHTIRMILAYIISDGDLLTEVGQPTNLNWRIEIK